MPRSKSKAPKEEIAATAKTKKNLKSEDFLEIIPLIDPINKPAVRTLAKEKWGLGRTKADELLNELVDIGVVSLSPVWSIGNKEKEGIPEGYRRGHACLLVIAMCSPGHTLFCAFFRQYCCVSI
jgi:hypothetical protein